MKQTIEADKPGMIAYLTDKLDYHRAAAKDESRTLRDRKYSGGVAHGLELAISAIEAWELPGGGDGQPNADVAADFEYTERISKAKAESETP